MIKTTFYERIVSVESKSHTWRARLWLKADEDGVCKLETAARTHAAHLLEQLISKLTGATAEEKTAWTIAELETWNDQNSEPMSAAEVINTFTGAGNIALWQWP
jgi:hypothetical protein